MIFELRIQTLPSRFVITSHSVGCSLIAFRVVAWYLSRNERHRSEL